MEFFQINYSILFCSPIDKLYNGINIFAIQQKLGTQCQKNVFSGHHPAGRTMKNFKWTSELQFLPYHIFKHHFSFVFTSRIQLILYKKWKKLLKDDQKCQFSLKWGKNCPFSGTLFFAKMGTGGPIIGLQPKNLVFWKLQTISDYIRTEKYGLVIFNFFLRGVTTWAFKKRAFFGQFLTPSTPKTKFLKNFIL